LSKTIGPKTTARGEEGHSGGGGGDFSGGGSKPLPPRRRRRYEKTARRLPLQQGVQSFGGFGSGRPLNFLSLSPPKPPPAAHRQGAPPLISLI